MMGGLKLAKKPNVRKIGKAHLQRLYIPFQRSGADASLEDLMVAGSACPLTKVPPVVFKGA